MTKFNVDIDSISADSHELPLVQLQIIP